MKKLSMEERIKDTILSLAVLSIAACIVAVIIAPIWMIVLICG